MKPATSDWTPPIAMASKIDDILRFGVYCRLLNTMTRRYSYLIPRTDEYIDSLSDATIYTQCIVTNILGKWRFPLRTATIPL